MGLFLCKSSEELKDENDLFNPASGKRKMHRRPTNKDLYHSKYSFVHWKICKEYLKCDIKPCKKFKRKNALCPSDLDPERISFDYLPTKFFDDDCPYEERRLRRKMRFTINGITYKRVVGYREIMMKREYLEYLRDLSCVEDDELCEVIAQGGGPKKGAAPYDPYAAIASRAKKHHADAPPTSRKASKEKAKAKPILKKKSVAKKKKKKKTKDSEPSCFANFFSFNWLAGASEIPTKEKMKEKVKKNAEQILKHQAVKKWKWPNKRKRYPVPKSNPPGKYIVLLHRLYRLPKENEERDNEWLYLSSTSEDEQSKTVSHFQKGLHNWMTPGISFESQKFFRQVGLWWTLMGFTGRNFLHKRNNFYRGHAEFSCTKGRMIPFFITSTLLWTVLCLSVIGYFDILFERTIYEDNIFLRVERIELKKYGIPFAALVLVNLTLVAIWSFAVILGDGSLIAHYMNCWCAALHEMGTSGVLDMRKLILKNVQIFIFYALGYTAMFVLNWPGLVRGSCLLTSMLVFRPVIPLLRINHPKKLVVYQFIGLGIQLFILFCARLIMCTLQIFGLMLKNVCEMWNFKFALRFKLLAKESKGQFYQLELNHSLAKLWSHHKLIVVLIEEYGVVFCIGIMCYIVPQVGMFAVVLARLILSSEGNEERDKFYGNVTNVEIYSDREPTIYIPYYHPAIEEVFMAAIIFLHIAIDFFFTTETLVAATDAFMTGGEFVRRAGIMTSKKSHERRLIFSLHWSFSPTRLRALTCNRFFTLDRQSLLQFFSFIILIFTIIIRLHKPEPPIKVVFPPKGSCNEKLGQILIHGICTIKTEPETTPPPILPPADYYFFMEHCSEIEKNYTNLTASFEYFTDNSSGVNLTANKPPFLICKVNIDPGTPLPPQLENYGRYFQDHGSPQLREILKLIFNQTHDPTKINYLNITASIFNSHSDTTGGGYCGPDVGGQQGKLCEWVEYYRDCVIVCKSKILNRNILLQKMWKKMNTSFELYTDYSKIDCGINPFGYFWKGDNISIVEPAYDCFGREVKLGEMDLCGNIPLKIPVAPYKPIKGDKRKIYRSYASDWSNVNSKTFVSVSPPPPPSPPPCDHCYDYDPPARDRCSIPTLVKNHCPYSRYWGEHSAQKGYYLAEQCFRWDIDNLDQPKPTGFCHWNYVQGGIIQGHVVNQTTYVDARKLVWDKEWDLKNGQVPPCKQPVFQGLRQIVHHLYFQHSCLVPSNSSGSCEPPEKFHFEAYRPYEIVNCKLRQIKLDYEVIGGNSQICDLSNRTMRVPNISNPISLKLKGGKSQSYNKFYGCRGGHLVPTGQGYICTTPEVGGVCEVDSLQGYLGYWDCKDPDVIGAPGANIGQPDDKLYGLCTADFDNNAPEFKDYQRKLVAPELLTMLKHTSIGWNTGDPWRYRLTVPIRVPNITLPAPVCDKRWPTIYCGWNSIPLHYSFDGRNTRQDFFQCNWEAFWRDCLFPYQSDLMKGVNNSVADWVYLPEWVVDSTRLQHPMQRRNFPILNVFAGITGMVGCDGRKLPDTNYWRDDCGWVMTAEFTDGDPKSIGVMPPILAIGHVVYSEEGNMTREIVLNCYDTKMALCELNAVQKKYRCTHPEIFPLCPHTLSNWKPARDIIDNNCFRFNTSCYLDFNKKPDGFSLLRPNTYPEGFCRGFCAKEDLKNQDLISETFIDKWRTLHTLSFSKPPCLDFSVAPTLFLDPKNPRPIELHLFFEFHCSDKANNGVIRDFLTNGVSGSFHWPLYKENSTGNFRFVPLKPLLDHLTQKFGKSCDYGGYQNEPSIYPQNVIYNDSKLLINITREEFLGCHGKPLIWLRGIIDKNPQETNAVGVKDVVKDYQNVCFGLLMGGWCEVDFRPFYFLRDDFEVNCDESKGALLPSNCPKECTDMQGQFKQRFTEFEELSGDEEEYHPFVKSKEEYLISNNYSSSSPTSGGVLASPPRTDIPYRRLTADEFEEAKRKWALFQDSTKHAQYIKEFQDLLQGPDELHCYHKDPAKFKKYCIWPFYVQQCYVPCKFIYPEKIITNVSQSLVNRHPGQGSMYLMPLAFVTVGSSVEPAFSFGDCAIDPSQYSREGIMGCNLENITDHDFFKWGNFPEFLPDPSNKIVDPSTSFNWIPWALNVPSRAPFTYKLLTDYLNPKLTYSQSPIPSSQQYSVTKQVFISPYLACHRFSREDIRIPILTGIETYWNSSVLPRVQMVSSHFSYFPNSKVASEKTCQETYVHVYLYWEACKFWNVPSKVLRIYGFCRAIFPAAVVHGSYAAISEDLKFTPPQGCINRKTDSKTFDATYNSTSGFGLKYSMFHVYETWNSLCHSCAYTREMHAANLRRTWCGWAKDENPTCLSPMESFNKGRQPIEFGQGIFNAWHPEVQNIGLLWKLAVEYSCWSDNLNRWQFYTRWETYHPWSLKLENTTVAAYPIHIAMNALACPYPCKGPDESEDCNSLCPHHLHNPCDVKPWEGNFFHSAQTAGLNNGLNYTVILKDKGNLCTSQLIGLNGKPEGLGIFGSYGANFIQCENQTCLMDREGPNTFWGTSEGILLDDQWIPSRSGPKKNVIVYPEVIDSAVGVRGPEQAVVPDSGEAPRMMVVHPGYYPNYTGDMYSTFCAALQGDLCELVDVQFGNSTKPGPPWQSTEEYLFCNDIQSVSGYLEISVRSDCTIADEKLFLSLVQTNPANSWDTGAYCCIPYQADRQKCAPSSNESALAFDWADKYWATVRDSWKMCEDKLDSQTGQSVFGFPFTWDKNARYLRGCRFSDCLGNKCAHKLRGYKGTTDTDFCNRQFDPEENFKLVPLQPCDLRVPPF